MTDFLSDVDVPAVVLVTMPVQFQKRRESFQGGSVKNPGVFDGFEPVQASLVLPVDALTSCSYSA